MPDLQGPVRYRGGIVVPRIGLGAGIAAFVALMLLWQVATGAGWVSPYVLPPPLAVVRALWAALVSGELWQDLGPSLGRLAAGWALGTVAGLVPGIIVGLSLLASSPRTAPAPATSLMLKAAPLFVINVLLGRTMIPLVIIWFGSGDASKVLIVALGVVLPTVAAVAVGIGALPRSLLRMGRAYGLSRGAILARIVLPCILPAILACIPIVALTAILLLLASEMAAGEWGIGVFIMRASAVLAVDQVLAGLAVALMLGLGLVWVAGRLEWWFLRWQ